MELEDDKQPKRLEIIMGEDLSTLSVDELKRRITVFKAEIERFNQAIAEKQKSREAANSVFKL